MSGRSDLTKPTATTAPFGLRRAPPPLLGCRWAWLGAPPTASGGGSRAPPAMPIDSLRAAEAPGSGQKESRIRIDIIIVANVTSFTISGGGF